MKRITPLILLLFLFTKSGISQGMHSITIGPDLGLGSNFGKTSKVSIGGSIEYVARLNEIFGIRLAGGYNRFNGKTYDGYVSFLPLRTGLQYFLYRDIFYMHTDIGIARYSASSGTKKTGPYLAIGAGFRQSLLNDQFIQFSSYFNFYKLSVDPPGDDLNYTWFNLRVAYGFSFGKKINTGEE